MRFHGLDLNLLNALHVLLKHRSVTLAAEEIHLSQSAMSGALNRLRDYFKDDLLIQCGRTMVPTAKANELAQPLQEALQLIRANITTPAVFDPATSTRRFILTCSDYVYHILLSDTLRELEQSAPQVSFDLMSPTTETNLLFDQGGIDITITVDVYAPSEFTVNYPLFEDRYAIACWSENPHCKNGVDMATFSRLHHVVTRFGAERAPEYSDICFKKDDVERLIDLSVSSFSEIPQSIIGTHRLATMHRRHAEYFAKYYPISVHELPIKLPVVQEIACVHQSKANDSGVRWLLEKIQAQAATIA